MGMTGAKVEQQLHNHFMAAPVITNHSCLRPASLVNTDVMWRRYAQQYIYSAACRGRQEQAV